MIVRGLPRLVLEYIIFASVSASLCRLIYMQMTVFMSAEFSVMDSRRHIIWIKMEVLIRVAKTMTLNDWSVLIHTVCQPYLRSSFRRLPYSESVHISFAGLAAARVMFLSVSFQVIVDLS